MFKRRIFNNIEYYFNRNPSDIDLQVHAPASPTRYYVNYLGFILGIILIIDSRQRVNSTENTTFTNYNKRKIEFVDFGSNTLNELIMMK